MKRYLCLLSCLVFFAAAATAQLQKQSDTTTRQTIRVIPLDKALLLKNMSLIANMQYSNNSYFQDGKYTNSKFALNQFRLELKGQVFNHVFFRFRDRYTRNPETQSVDNISHSTDLAFIGIEVSPTVSLAFGKMCADYGGYEFDANPIDIYQYNDIVDYADNFLTGAQVSWKAFANHQFTFQVLNARTRSFSELYGVVPGITDAKFPTAIVGNWRGNFLDGKFSTLWNYTLITEAKDKYIYYTALGNQFSSKKWLIQYDFKYEKEDIDRTTLVTGFVPEDLMPFPAMNTTYVEHWLHIEYALNPKWKASVIGMVSDAYWSGNPDPGKDDHIRTAWGLIPSLEFYPFAGLNLKFFTTYVARFYNFSDYSKINFGSTNTTTGRIMIGFISPLVVL